MDQIIDEASKEYSYAATEQNDECSMFTFEIDNTRPEVTEVDESEIKHDPHETFPEGIKYRT